MDCSTPGFPVHHQLLELAPTHVHPVSDVMQPSHPLSSLSPPAFNLSQNQGLSQWVSSSDGQSIGVSASASVLPMNIQDWLPSGLTGLISLQSKGPSRVFFNTAFKRINYLVLSLLYGPTLTSIHDHWKNLIVFKACWPPLSPLIFTAVLWARNEAPKYKTICPKPLS